MTKKKIGEEKEKKTSEHLYHVTVRIARDFVPHFLIGPLTNLPKQMTNVGSFPIGFPWIFLNRYWDRIFQSMFATTAFFLLLRKLVVDSSVVRHFESFAERERKAVAAENQNMTTAEKPSLNIDSKLLEHWNKTLSTLSPQEILQWSVLTFPGLYQTTAFGLTGLCIIDMLSKLESTEKDAKNPVELVFIDTLYHFPQTLELVSEVEKKYPSFKLHVYKPEGCESDTDFVAKYGDELWSKDELKYDYLVKVEPLKRAYEELGIMVVFTGRRRSQGSARAELPIIEVDETMKVIKINPLASWSFSDVKKYVDENQVPYNQLLDLGYKSVGDWHSTEPVAEGEDERSGRWKGKAKTECGIHVTSNYSQFLSSQKK